MRETETWLYGSCGSCVEHTSVWPASSGNSNAAPVSPPARRRPRPQLRTAPSQFGLSSGPDREGGWQPQAVQGRWWHKTRSGGSTTRGYMRCCSWCRGWSAVRRHGRLGSPSCWWGRPRSLAWRRPRTLRTDRTGSRTACCRW